MILHNWSDSLEAAGYRQVAALFLRLLALIYLAAFVSIGVQIVGLAGADGILPFQEQLDAAGEQFGIQRFWFLPTLFWIDAGDLALQAVAVVGVLGSLLLLFNRWVRFSLILSFVCYLSLFQAGQLFMNFQWDYLLLESGFLAIFVPRGPRLVVWLMRWLLFRFRFLSGSSKLLSGDPTWADLTALEYYFETQPLPQWISWYFHHFPDWLLRAGTGMALFIEILVPFMMFLSRGPRFFAAWATILLQLLILLTSNHNFFNLLTIVLCLFLFDDRALARVTPAFLRQHSTPPSAQVAGKPLLVAVAGLVLVVSSVQIWEMFSGRRAPEPIADLMQLVAPFHVVNKYHVFPTIKTERRELIIEGSDDGQTWQPYVFKYKPGPLDRRPEIVVPHQPRLDWMLWFVPPGHPLNLMWYDRFLHRLLENAPAVTDLLEKNPFAKRPPTFIRTSVYRYRFSEPDVKRDTGRWWEREYLGPFYPLPWVVAPAPAAGTAASSGRE